MKSKSVNTSKHIEVKVIKQIEDKMITIILGFNKLRQPNLVQLSKLFILNQHTMKHTCNHFPPTYY